MIMFDSWQEPNFQKTYCYFILLGPLHIPHGLRCIRKFLTVEKNLRCWVMLLFVLMLLIRMFCRKIFYFKNEKIHRKTLSNIFGTDHSNKKLFGTSQLCLNSLTHFQP